MAKRRHSRNNLSTLHTIQTEQTSMFQVNTGVRGHLHSTSHGEILLAAMPDNLLIELVDQLTLRRLTPYTLTSTAELLTQVRHVRTGGYAVANEEKLVDIILVGAPVRDASGKVVAVASSAAHRDGQPGDFHESMIRVTERAAGSMSRRLGARPGAPFDYLAASPGRTTR